MTDAKCESGGSSNTPAQCTDRTGKIRVLIDWLGFTFNSEESSLDAVLQLFYDLCCIDFNDWNVGRRNYEGYANSLTFENINIYFDGAENQGIHVDITGQGCRYIEVLYQKLRVQELQKTQVTWFEFINAVVSVGGKFTRVDIAIDDFSQYYTVPYLFQKCLSGELTMKFKSWRPDGAFGADGVAKNGMTLYFGSAESRFQVCIYEKGLQLGTDLDWTRTELRFKHERAVEFINVVLSHASNDKDYSIGVLAAGILKEYITFRDRNDNDSNKRRWKVSPFWSEFLQGVEPLRLTSALPDRSILKTSQWFKDQVSKSYVMMGLAFHGIRDDWMQRMVDEGKKKLTKRDMEIIAEYRRLYDANAVLKLDNIIDDQKKTTQAQVAKTNN